MTRLVKGILHPIRASRWIAARLGERRARASLRRQFQHVARASRETCWCGGALRPFPFHPSYAVCEQCGCYVNRRPPLQEALAEIYSVDSYWRQRQALRGHPTIEARARRYREDGRLDKWIGYVQRYGPPTGRAVVEVGCAPGVLLQELQSRGYPCIGVEINPDVARWMQQTTGLDVRSGFFPGVELPQCDIFLAFDVLEHSPCPEKFMQEVARLLRGGGVAIIQTGIDRYDFTPPFGERFDMFDDVEHLFLFTDRAMQKLAEAAGLEVVSLAERVFLAGEIAVFRKP